MQEQFPYNTNSNYNSLQVTLTRHLTTNLGFLAAYTWSKTIGYVDSNGPSGYERTRRITSIAGSIAPWLPSTSPKFQTYLGL